MPKPDFVVVKATFPEGFDPMTWRGPVLTDGFRLHPASLAMDRAFYWQDNSVSPSVFVSFFGDEHTKQYTAGIMARRDVMAEFKQAVKSSGVKCRFDAWKNLNYRTRHGFFVRLSAGILRVPSGFVKNTNSGKTIFEALAEVIVYEHA